MKHLLPRFLRSVLGPATCAACLLASPATASAKDVAIVIDASKTKQTLEGFGATHQSLAYGATDYLGALREKAIDAAYGQVGLNTGNLGSFISTPPNRPQYEAPGYGMASANEITGATLFKRLAMA